MAQNAMRVWRTIGRGVTLGLLVWLLWWPASGVRADSGGTPPAVAEKPTDDKAGADKETVAEKKPPVDAGKMLAQVDRKLHPESFELFAQVTSQLPNGRTSQLSLYVVRGKGKQSAALILSPDHLAGRAILRLEDEVWMHVPGELELRPTALNHVLMGTTAGTGAFNNADLLLTDLAVDYKATLLEEAADSYLLELLPRDARLPYTKQILRVDRKLLLPKSLQQYGANGILLKTVTFDKVSNLFGFPRPEVMQATGGPRNPYAATWQLGSLKARPFPAEAFTKEFLPRVGTLFK
ncbi:MAG: outer membrane lipoprotein-sorting protein [Magnetococcales bacterium]|nr:outer membrane lipoprotein-sorting protein [Magnetococcales bacterium]